MVVWFKVKAASKSKVSSRSSKSIQSVQLSVVIDVAEIVVPVVIVRSSLMVTAESVSEITPDRESVVIPERAPVVETSKAVESRENVSPLSPRSICPLASNNPLAVNVPETVRLDEAVVASERVMALDPESITIFPVVEPPRVKVPMLRDWITPSPPIDIPGLLAAPTADTEAVGVPEFIFNTANSALAVAVAPIKKSLVAFDG